MKLTGRRQARWPVDIEIAVQAEDLGDIQPLLERHQGEIGDITGQIGSAFVELHDAGAILREQVDRLDPTAAEGPKQVDLSGQDAGITGIRHHFSPGRPCLRHRPRTRLRMLG